MILNSKTEEIGGIISYSWIFQQEKRNVLFENVTIVSSSTEYQAANYYTDTSGSIVDLGVDGSGNLLDPGELKNEITNEQAYFNINESLRQISVIRPNLINNVVSSYKKAIRE